MGFWKSFIELFNPYKLSPTQRRYRKDYPEDWIMHDSILSNGNLPENIRLRHSFGNDIAVEMKGFGVGSFIPTGTISIHWDENLKYQIFIRGSHIADVSPNIRLFTEIIENRTRTVTSYWPQSVFEIVDSHITGLGYPHLNLSMNIKCSNPDQYDTTTYICEVVGDKEFKKLYVPQLSIYIQNLIEKLIED